MLHSTLVISGIIAGPWSKPSAPLAYEAHSLVQSLLSILLLILCALSIYGIGAAAARAMRFSAWSVSADLAYAVALGTGALVIALFVLGLLGWLVPAAAWGLVITGLLLLPLSLPMTRRIIAALIWRAGQLRRAHAGWWLLAALMAGQIALNLVADLAPPLEGDTITNYMLTARYWAQEGRYFQPEHVWASTLPGHMMMLSAWGMLLRGPTPATQWYGYSMASLLSGFLMSLSLALAVYALARVRYGARVGLAAAIILFMMPDAIYLAESGKVDMGWAFFEALALAALLRWTVGPPGSEPEPRWLVVAAVMTGLSLGSKSQAVLSLPFLAGWIAVIAIRRAGPVEALRAIAVFGVVALVVGLPYLGYNAVMYRNPFYPVLANQFARVLGATPFFRSELGTEIFYPWNPLGYVHNLWDASLGHPPPFYLGFWAGPAYLMLLPLSLLLPRQHPQQPDRMARGLLLYAFLFSIVWFLVKQAARHFLPGLVLLAVIAGTILRRVDEQPPWVRRTVFGALGAGLALGTGVFLGINRTNGTLLAATGRLTPEEFIARWADTVVSAGFPDSEILSYLNTELEPGARVYNPHANLALYFRHDQVSASTREPTNAWLTDDEETLLETFDRYNVDYLVVFKFSQGSDSLPLILRPEFYETHGVRIYESPRTYLYRIEH